MKEIERQTKVHLIPSHYYPIYLKKSCIYRESINLQVNIKTESIEDVSLTRVMYDGGLEGCVERGVIIDTFILHHE
jgi:hypothetical protein